MQNRREILSVKKQFQEKFIIITTVIPFILINLLFIATFVMVDTVQDLFALNTFLAIMLAIGEMTGLAIVYFYSLRMSHRIAGPVYVLENRLKEIASGNLMIKTTIRKDDYFHETAELFNNCVKKLNESMTNIQTCALELSNHVKSDQKGCELSSKLMNEINHFKINNDCDADNSI